MPFVQRDLDGRIVSLHRDPVPGGEELPPSHPDVQAFLQADEAQTFAALDANLVRVLEDLIDVLIRRNVLCVTDLPAEAQAKLFERKHFREGMHGHSLKLFGDQPLPGTEGLDDSGGPLTNL